MPHDTYKDKVLSASDPVRSVVSVTPDDNTDLIRIPRALYIGGDGDIALILADDLQAVTFKNVTGFLPLMPKRILATGTTATSILALL